MAEPPHRVRPFRLGQHDTVRPGGDDRGEIAQAVGAVERVDPHPARRAIGDRRGEPFGDQRARRRLARGGDRILQVEDQRVRLRA